MINDNCEIQSDFLTGSIVGSVVVSNFSTNAGIETSSILDTDFYSEISKITFPVHKVIKKLGNDSVSLQANEILSNIEITLDTFQLMNKDVSYLPLLDATIFDDGSLLIEWPFPDFRLGFGIELNPKESGWYIVTNAKLKEVLTSDYLDSISINELVKLFVGFALQNS